MAAVSDRVTALTAAWVIIAVRFWDEAALFALCAEADHRAASAISRPGHL